MSDGSNSDGQEKSHDPTPKKLDQSREKGDVPYSTEVTSASTYCAFFISLLIFSGWTAQRLSHVLATLFQRPEDYVAAILSPSTTHLLSVSFIKILVAVAPFFGFLALASITSIIAQRAYTFAPSKISPKISRISIIANAKQKFGPHGLTEFLKSLSKLLAVMGILFFAFQDRFLSLPALSGLPFQSITLLIQRETIFFIGLTTIAAVFIAAIDLPWRRHQHHNKLKMTYDELKKENKESEGDPSLKGARRRKAEELATNRMMCDVPSADLIMVNPTHYAVALKWKRDGKSAPICVAKGVDEVAAKIREAAASAGVPIHRDPPTTRSMYEFVQIGKEIKREHYAAVAAAMHYADQMRKKWHKA